LIAAITPMIVLAGCGSSDPYPAASPAMSSACQAIDKYFLAQIPSESQVKLALRASENSGNATLRDSARAYEAAALRIDQSGMNEAFAKMVGTCQDYGIGPNQNGP
jgi:hypothetical protein